MVKGFDGRNNESLPHLLGVCSIPHLLTGPPAIPNLHGGSSSFRGRERRLGRRRQQLRAAPSPAVRKGLTPPPAFLRTGMWQSPSVLFFLLLALCLNSLTPPPPTLRKTASSGPGPPFPGEPLRPGLGAPGRRGRQPPGAEREPPARPPQPQRAGTRPFLAPAEAPKCQSAGDRPQNAAQLAPPERLPAAGQEQCQLPSRRPAPGAAPAAPQQDEALPAPSAAAAAVFHPRLPHWMGEVRLRMR